MFLYEFRHKWNFLSPWFLTYLFSLYFKLNKLAISWFAFCLQVYSSPLYPLGLVQLLQNKGLTGALGSPVIICLGDQALQLSPVPQQEAREAWLLATECAAGLPSLPPTTENTAGVPPQSISLKYATTQITFWLATMPTVAKEEAICK
jgi:hypothetical protein